MNHIYRSIWSEALGAWIAVSENTKSKGKHSTRKKLLVTGLLFCCSNGWALPTGEQLVAGQATINTPNAGQMQIDQTSQQAIVNWQGFSIAPNESVNIQQPNPQAALLNRVVGQDASQIQGQLNANGQVYLVNPNGVVFGKTAQVDVGGLVASNHNIADADFLNGINHFTQNGTTASIDNQGTIKTPDGGVVALISQNISNTGSITAPKGTAIFAAGKTVDLDFKGNGLVEVKVPEAALNAQITNKGAIQADGGRVVLTAKAAGQLIDTVINQDGIIRAQGLANRNGEIILDGGDNGTVQVSGTLDTSSQQTGGNIKVTGGQINIQNGATVNASGDAGGGYIAIGDKQITNQTIIQQGTTISAEARDHGTAGKIDVFANMNNGTVTVAGQLDTSAPINGNGGFIDTSAAHVKIADTAKVNTKANNGTSGIWLIDPVDFTIAATGGDMTGAFLSASLAGGSVTIASTSGASGANGDVNVNDIVSWSANTLTLNAQSNININANMNGLGSAKLALQYGQSALAAGNTSGYFMSNSATINLPAGSNFSTKLGSDGAVKNYTVITSLGSEGSTTGLDLQGMNGNLSGNYALGANIDASETNTWNAEAGFTPVGISSFRPFTGNFAGLGHTITNLVINRPLTNYVGLFGITGFTSASNISNVGLLGGKFVGNQDVGALVGYQQSGSINNVYATGSVTGSDQVGGLVGINQGSISNVFATGSVSANTEVGGLVGINSGVIINSYATGNVSGTANVGGLIGNFSSSPGLGTAILSNSYATGRVSGGDNVGGLIGANTSSTFGIISNSFWDTLTTGQSIGVGVGNNTGVTGKTTTEMQQLATFSNAGWSIANTGGSSAVWRIYEGNTTPWLRSFLTPLIITTDGTSNNYSIAGANTSGHLFGSGTRFYSDQRGFDILLVVTLPPAPIFITQSERESQIVALQTAKFTPFEYNAPPDFNLTDEKIATGTVLKMKNSAGAVKRLQLSANKQFLSLLLEDGSVRVWDFQRGIQRKIQTEHKEQALTDISAVDDKGELLSISSKFGIGPHDIISSVIDEKLALEEEDINHFVSTDDGNLLLVNMGDNKLTLWNNKQGKEIWTIDHKRGVVSNLALSNNQRYAAVLSRQSGAYALKPLRHKLQATPDNMPVGTLKAITDAVDIIDLSTGKIIKSLPNTGDQIVYIHFKDNGTLSLGLAGGALSDWDVATGHKKSSVGFDDEIEAVDNIKDTFAYVTNNGIVRVGKQDQIQLSVQNKDNPVKFAKLLENGNKLLTVLTNGDSALWDVATGKKTLRLYSTLQGWTVMDGFGRFDGSDDSIENFTWMVDEKDEIPLDGFSENYYEPGLLTNVLQNQDYLNNNPEMIEEGVNLPPKVEIQLAEQQTKTNEVAVKLDVYDRGGGINKIQIYHNGKLLNNQDSIATQINEQDDGEHRVLNFAINPSAGKNTLKVLASNDSGIENSSSEISFDGKSKAYQSATRLMTVGLNQYSDSDLNLKYSVADAELIGTTIKNNSNMIASKTLINEKATKPQILAELKELSQGAQQDVLVLYFAGHGIAVGKEWYFLPYETKLESTPEQIAKYGVTGTELSDIFKNSKIQHILLMVDACYAGAGLDAISKLENGQRYLSRRLSRSLGITVITAAAKDQEAAELESLGHGLFTYLIVDEIEKKKANNAITAHSIADNIAKTLPQFSKELLGASQDPAVYTKGNDFMLTDFNRDKK